MDGTNLEQEEKIIEINIQIDKPIVLLLLLVIIISQSVYIGYTYLNPKKQTENTGQIPSQQENKEPESPEIPPIAHNITNLEPARTFEEMTAHLNASGCQNIIRWGLSNWNGKHLNANYTEALAMAGESPFVGVDEGILAFIFLKDGEAWIYFIP